MSRLSGEDLHDRVREKSKDAPTAGLAVFQSLGGKLATRYSRQAHPLLEAYTPGGADVQ